MSIEMLTRFLRLSIAYQAQAQARRAARAVRQGKAGVARTAQLGDGLTRALNDVERVVNNLGASERRAFADGLS